MTEVPNAILWIAAISLIIQTLLIAGLVIALLVLVGKVNQLVGKVNDLAEPVKEATQSIANTVSSFSGSLLSPLATAAGIFAGFRRGKRRRR